MHIKSIIGIFRDTYPNFLMFSGTSSPLSLDSVKKLNTTIIDVLLHCSIRINLSIAIYIYINIMHQKIFDFDELVLNSNSNTANSFNLLKKFERLFMPIYIYFVYIIIIVQFFVLLEQIVSKEEYQTTPCYTVQWLF